MILATLTLPWPPRALNPNGRAHWAKRTAPRKAQKAAAYAEGLERGLHLVKGRIPAGATIGIHWMFCPPPRAAHSYDDDNFEAAMKAARDQIAAMIGVDDKRFSATKERGPIQRPAGAVICTLSIADDWQSIGSIAQSLAARAGMCHEKSGPRGAGNTDTALNIDANSGGSRDV